MLRNLFLSLLLSFLFSCPSQAESLANIEFIPDQIEAETSISVEAEAASADEMEITLLAHDLSQPVLGFAFNLNFNPDFVKYGYFKKGEFLEQGGDPIYLITTNEKNQGQLISGIILKRGDELPTGSGKIVTLFFEILNSGETNLSFDKTVVSTLTASTADSPGKRQDLDDIAWSGGILKINSPLEGDQMAQTNTFNLEPYFNGLLIIIIIGCLFYTLYKITALSKEKRLRKM